MRTNLLAIREEVQAGHITVTTVKPILLKIEARAHPHGIACQEQILDEQENCWQSCPQEKEPKNHIPFLFF